MKLRYQVEAPEGMVETISPSIRRILAPNPSPMTFTGTNTYLLGTTEIAVVDPGPDNCSHLNAIVKAITPGTQITKILITHSHMDHSPLAKALSLRCGAKVYAYGDSFSGRSKSMVKLAQLGTIGGGEGVDIGFQPDITLLDGAKLKHDGGHLTALWTPGHFGNHMSFSYGKYMFCGDHVMGWASSMVSPPDGDLVAFRDSCARLLTRPEIFYLPGHGNPIEDGPTRLRWLLEHREDREIQILTELGKQSDTARGLAEKIYSDIDPYLVPAATRNVLAHLIDLNTRKIISANGTFDLNTKYSTR